jgi:act minimal PKS acyl carrier protein
MDLTLQQLESIMKHHVWDGAWQSFEDAPDVRFDELGYDSLALLETYSHIKRAYRIEITEDEMNILGTPRAFVDFVNSRRRSESSGDGRQPAAT